MEASEIRSVDAVVLRKNLGQYVNEAYYRGDEFVIERAGKPVAALVPLADLEKLESLRSHGFKVLRGLWAKNKRASFATVVKDVQEAVRRVRRRR